LKARMIIETFGSSFILLQPLFKIHIPILFSLELAPLIMPYTFLTKAFGNLQPNW